MRRARRSALSLVAALLLGAPAVAAQQRITEVQVAPRYLRMRVDAQVTLIATAYDTAGMPATVAIRWHSSNINVATVTPEGVVRALGPGQAIVSAYLEEGGRRRRAGQATVFVQREPGPIGPPAAGAPPHGPPAPAPRPGARPRLDSLVRATVNCDEPFMNTANPLRTCWDRRPSTRNQPVLEPPAACTVAVQQVRVLVLVGESGTADSIRVFTPSPCAEYNDAVEAHVRTFTFQPATKDGRPVRAWLQLNVRPDPKGLRPAAGPPLDAGQPGRLEPGRRVVGRLEPGDDRRASGGLLDVWEFDGRAGQDVMIDMRSDDFDTYLELHDPRGAVVAEDDDGGEDTDSFLAARLAASGRYRVVARSFGDNERTGAYDLTLTAGTSPAPGRGGDIQDGEAVLGRLEPGDLLVGDSTWVDVWTFRAGRDGPLVIEMASREFDTYLIARDSDGQLLGTDDDGGDGTNSRLTIRVQAGRSYRIYANSYGREPVGGVYRVIVRFEP